MEVPQLYLLDSAVKYLYYRSKLSPTNLGTYSKFYLGQELASRLSHYVIDKIFEKTQFFTDILEMKIKRENI